jgi:two-component system NtrC family sensor kinase
VIDHLRDGVVIADATGCVIDANPGALAILGRARADVRGARLGELLAPLGRDAGSIQLLGERFEQLAPDAAAAPVELSTRQERRIEVTARCLRAANGETLGRFAVLRDRTDERRTEHLLRQSQKLETVGSLVAGVAHEINNPLAFVLANLSQLERLADWCRNTSPRAGRATRRKWRRCRSSSGSASRASVASAASSMRCSASRGCRATSSRPST